MRWTREMLAQIERDIAAGMPAREIAAQMGASESSFRSACHNNGIYFRKPSAEMIVAISPALREKIEAAARRRKISAKALVTRIVETVINDGLLQAVIDE